MSGTRFEATGAVDASRLAEPLTFHYSKRTTKNRLLKAAMAEAQSSWHSTDIQARGIPSKSYIELYRRWGEHKNNWGIIITGNISIELAHPIGGADPVISLESPFSGERFEAFKSVAAAAKANGSLIIPQVSHPGRQAQERFQSEPISASTVPLDPKLGMTFAKPRAATHADISRIVAGFAHAAQYLEKAGFDGMELHGAHGYLIAQFLSNTTNRRTDSYGGSVANRARLLVEIIQEARRRVSPSFVIGAKLNSVEFQSGGLTPQEAAELVGSLQRDDVGLDFIELSGGTYEELGLSWTKESTRQRESFFLEFAELIVPALGATADERKTKVFITGGLRTVPAMVRALDVVDGVGVARPAAQEPALAADIIEGRVAGAIRPLEPFDNDMGLGLVASASQMAQIGAGLEPFDLSDREVVEGFQKDMAAHFVSPPEVGPVAFSSATKPYESKSRGVVQAA